MTTLLKATVQPSVGVGQRRLLASVVKNGELGGGFAALPAAGVGVTSDILQVAGRNGFMVIITSTLGGDLYYTNQFNPPRVTDLTTQVNALAAGTQAAMFGKGTAAFVFVPSGTFFLMTLTWDNNAAGALSAITLLARGKP